MTPKDKALFAAIRAGDLAAVQAALAEGADVNAEEMSSIVIDRASYDGTNSPLRVAAERGQLEILRLLLAAPGIDVNAGDAFAGATALCLAAWRGHEDCAVALLQAGADPNLWDGWERLPPAGFAMRIGNEGLVLKLIEAGTDLGRYGAQLAELARHYGLKAAQARIAKGRKDLWM